jgi:antitoxin component of MazEF toxin-antitoxin module
MPKAICKCRRHVPNAKTRETIRKAKANKGLTTLADLGEMLAGYRPSWRRKETDWGSPRGREAW